MKSVKQRLDAIEQSLNSDCPACAKRPPFITYQDEAEAANPPPLPRCPVCGADPLRIVVTYAAKCYVGVSPHDWDAPAGG